MKIYLLDCSKLQKLCAKEGFMEELCTKVDSFRRQKAFSLKQENSRAMSLAAGLLLQRVRKDYEADGMGAFRQDRTELTDKYASVMISQSGQANSQAPLWQQARPGCQSFPQQPAIWTRQALSTVCLQPETLLAEIQIPSESVYQIGKQGKPYFNDLPFFFSLSHSGEYVICVASDKEVGIDFQKKQPIDVLRLAERFFHESEVQALRSLGSSLERETLFYQMWTEKEAYGKLTGLGVGSVLGHNLSLEQKVCFFQTDKPDGYIGCIARYQQPYGKET